MANKEFATADPCGRSPNRHLGLPVINSLSKLLFLAYWVVLPVGSVAGQSLTSKLLTEDPLSLAQDARSSGDAIRGAILFPKQEMQCSKCHALGQLTLLGPDLSRIDGEVTDQQLVESLLTPGKVIKKGFETASVVTRSGRVLTGRVVERTEQHLALRSDTDGKRLLTINPADIEAFEPLQKSAMPDNLPDQLKNRQQFLDLVRYLMDMKSAADRMNGNAAMRPTGGGVLPDELEGIVLFNRLMCVACHQNDLVATRLPERQGPNLVHVARRLDPAYLERHILDPFADKPNSPMPAVLDHVDRIERARIVGLITDYLLSLDPARFERQLIDNDASERGERLYHELGCVACHAPREGLDDARSGDDEAQLGNLAAKYSLDGLTSFLEDPQATRPLGRMPGFRLTHWEARDIASFLLKRVDPPQRSAERIRLIDPNRVAQGETAFDNYGCIACHSIPGRSNTRMKAPLSQLHGRAGCLSGQPGAWPRYRLTEAQRIALRAAMSRRPEPLTVDEQIAVSLTALRCLSCHQRGTLGGIADDRDSFFHTSEASVGSQGRIPPDLTGVGAKLRPEWFRDVLVNGRSVRPYMTTRMPQFGAEVVTHLVDLMGVADSLDPAPSPDVSDKKELQKTGRDLVGNQGFNCVACHTYKQMRSETMPAVDLTQMSERLTRRWFYRYLLDPQHFSPNTLMPSYWPNGHSARKDVLDGSTPLQVEALWLYLLEGRQAGTPRGLIREPIEVLAGESAVMLRRAYRGVGKRGIGVGYREQLNLAFDAEQMRLGLIWKGKFADPAGAWRGQGSGTVRPLGTDLITFPEGPDLDDATRPWVPGDDRPPQHHFRGYYLDAQRRPTFMYQFRDMSVEDYTVDRVEPSSDHAFLRRTIRITSRRAQPDLRVRLARDHRILSLGSGRYQVGESLTVRVASPHAAVISERPDGLQLNVPITVSQGTTTLIIEYSW